MPFRKCVGVAAVLASPQVPASTPHKEFPTMLASRLLRFAVWLIPVVGIVLFLGIAPAADDDALKVLPIDAKGGNPRKMLADYLMQQCKVQFDVRRQAVAKLTTADEVKKRQEDLRAK